MTAWTLKIAGQAKKLIIIVTGFTILLIGIAMIVLPGPAIIVVPMGLAILSTEFVWAAGLLKTIKDKYQKTKEGLIHMRPSEREAEHFARIEFENKKKHEEGKHKRLAEEEKKRLKALHAMKCPKCGMELIEIDYKEIKIDKCSECDGVWLDAGEMEQVAKMDKMGLDKLFSVFKK